MSVLMHICMYLSLAMVQYLLQMCFVMSDAARLPNTNLLCIADF